MKHRAHIRLLAAALCLLLCVQVFAAESVDLERACSLTLHYTQRDAALAGQEIALYRAGDVHENGTYALTLAYPVEIQGITSEAEWQEAAATLSAYLTADAVAPHYTATTDETGTVSFTGLTPGLYLIRGLSAAVPEGKCVFADSFLFLPRNESGSYTYDVDANPKHASFMPTGEEYSVLKLWKDAGAAAERPAEVQVDILKDGVLAESVTLSAANDWRYSWSAPQGHSFTVVERNVPQGYTVTVTGNQTSFVITNTAPPDTDNPQTGDSAPILLYILLLCLSGMALVILGIWALGRKNHEKNR
ncbi:MAG: Cna B-type domain-containing protein [Oscillospiraceae bacterium]|nr:Cna B-type domain-containing protein [Oscillospiraceae bacterium]